MYSAIQPYYHSACAQSEVTVTLSDWAEVETTPSVSPLKSVKNGSKSALKILLTSRFSGSFSTQASTRMLQLDSAITSLLFFVLCIQQLDLFLFLYRFPIQKYHHMEILMSLSIVSYFLGFLFFFSYIWVSSTSLPHSTLSYFLGFLFFFSYIWVSLTSLPHSTPIFILQIILMILFLIVLFFFSL